MQQIKTQLRDRVVGQLLGTLKLKPFQVIALNIDDVAHDNGRLFLRVRCPENSVDDYKFIYLPKQPQVDLEVFLADGLPLYEKLSEALFPNRFGRRQTARNLRYRHQREYGVKRELVEAEKPVGVEFIQQFNLWNRAMVIYFAQRVDAVIKIGHSKCFSTRFQTLESEKGQMELLGLLEGSAADEKRVHSWFVYLCVEGKEWFEPAQELLDFIIRANTVGREVFKIYDKGSST